MLKVLTIVGTRPEIIKLSRVIPELDRHFEHVLVHTGQNYDYELNRVFFEQLELREPDYYLDAAGDSALGTIANVLVAAEKLLDETRPDALLILGDTNSCLVSIAAKKRKVPVFHMEAGNRCFDERVPEEVNRRIVDHSSDINLAYTEHARRYLLAEGLPPDRVMKTGSPMFEVLEYFKDKIAASDILETLGLEQGGYFVVSAHREENVDSSSNLGLLVDSLNLVAETYDFPVVFSVHPRTRERLARAELSLDERIIASAPLGFLDYVSLQTNAYCVLSDSGTITEESSLLNFPAITLRNAHERPEGMDVGVLVMSGLEPESVIQAIKVVTESRSDHDAEIVPDYVAPDVSRRVATIIASYTDYVRRVVWRGETGWS